MKKPKVLLALLPYWVPLIPPLGIACLKGFLQERGFTVKTVDLNIRIELREIYDRYFNVLREYIPRDKRMPGNSHYNIGHEVLQNHMMAHFNKSGFYSSPDGYPELLKIIIKKSYFIDPDDGLVNKLQDLISCFYENLERCVLKVLAEEKPDVLGISIYTHTLPASLFTFKIAKQKYPDLQTAAGGGVFSNFLAPGSPNLELFIRKTPYIDHIFIGEGEVLFLGYLQGKFPGSKKLFTREDTQGDILDLSSVSLPDFSDFNLQHYTDLPLYGSRGCPFQCGFCSETVQWGKFRKKDPVRIAGELRQLYRSYKRQLFWMCDSLLNPVISGLSQEIHKAGLPIYWDGYLRADKQVCDIHNTILWRKGGFYRARMGVESGSQKILTAMGKQITPGQIKQAVSALAYAGIKTTTYWVIGFPGETEEDFLQTLDLIKELQNDIYEAMCNPFYYYRTGQVYSDSWSRRFSSIPLYPGKALDALMVHTWLLDCEPSREEMFGRVKRFEEHCIKLGIPNPYSLVETNNADERWRKRHKNAVPSLMELHKDGPGIADESRSVRDIFLAENTQVDDGNFGF